MSETRSDERPDLWLVSGLRTPFAKVDGKLAERDAIEMSVPVARSMVEQLDGDAPDLMVWGAVAPNLSYSNIAREVLFDADLDPHTPAFSTVMACATSMAAVFEAAGQLGFGGRDVALCGGVESMSRVQLGLKEGLSVWLRRLSQARSMEDRLQIASQFDLGEVGLFIPSVKNRVTGKSMGEHCEEMAKEWEIPRQEQDEIALQSHRRAVRGSKEGFFDDLIVEVDGHSTDSFPREDTSLEALAKLRPSFDRDNGTITAGNSSPLTDGAAGVWLATDEGLARLPDDRHRVRLLDWEVAGVDIHNEGLLMAPGYAVPRLLTRHEMTYEDVGLWEIHEAFAAQILCNIESFESDEFLRERVGLEDPQLGEFPRERLNPNGGSVALGHPFGATGARILSQATKELAEMDAGTRAVVSICADGGLGAVALLEAG